MALNITGLQTSIKNAFEKHNDKPVSDLAAARMTLYNDLAAAIDAYVKSATVDVTLTTATSPSGAVTGKGVGQIT